MNVIVDHLEILPQCVELLCQERYTAAHLPCFGRNGQVMNEVRRGFQLLKRLLPRALPLTLELMQCLQDFSALLFLNIFSLPWLAMKKIPDFEEEQ